MLGQYQKYQEQKQKFLYSRRQFEFKGYPFHWSFCNTDVFKIEVTLGDGDSWVNRFDFVRAVLYSAVADVIELSVYIAFLSTL